MSLNRARVGVWHHPQSGVQALGFCIAGQPLRAVRKLRLVPALDPIMLAIVSPVITIVQLHEFEPVRLEILRQPVGVLHDVVLGYVSVISGPARPHHGRSGEVAVVEWRVERSSKNFRVVLGKQANRGIPGNRHPHIEQISS